MKKIGIILVLIALHVGIQAQNSKTLELVKPIEKGGSTVMEAFKKRSSTREFADKKLSAQELSNLLWAANGINRPESGKRTAPTAMNKQEIDLYVCLPEGAYLYIAKNHSLQLITSEDLRPLVAGGQAFAAKAPVCLVIVGDLEKFNGKELMPAMDAGIVSQNISLFCSGFNLVTVPRASMDQGKLTNALKLKASQRLLMNHPVGHLKP